MGKSLSNIFFRSLEKCQSLAALGANIVSHYPTMTKTTSEEAAIHSDVRDVVLGKEGLLAHMAPASILVDLTTSVEEMLEHEKGLFL